MIAEEMGELFFFFVFFNVSVRAFILLLLKRKNKLFSKKAEKDELIFSSHLTYGNVK